MEGGQKVEPNTMIFKLKLHEDPEAKQVAVHIPAEVPLHWKAAVNKGLDHNVQLRV